MSLQKKIGRDANKRMHLEHPRHAIYWSKKFEVSSIQLYKAVMALGTNRVDKVAEYLASHQ